MIHNNRLKINKGRLKIIGILLLLLMLPLTLIIVRYSQDLRSSAAAPDQLETESGVLSSSGVSKQSDSGASGGQFVRFDQSTVPTPTPNPNVIYTDYNVPSNIDATGATDVTTALNNWIATVPNGTSTKHTRIVFPQNAVYMLSRGILITGRSHVTFWGNGTTIKVNPNATGPYQYTSAFNVGWRYGGSPTAGISSGQSNTDIRITGFSGRASHIPIEGNFYATYENQAFIEAGSTDGLEVDNNTNIRGFGGDFMRIHGNNIHIHNNSQINAGRQFVSVIEGSNILIEDNSMGKVGYFFLDVEPNNSYEDVTDVEFINNTGESHSQGLTGGILAVGSGKPGSYGTIGRIYVRDNTLTGTSKAALNTYIGQNSGNRMSDIAITGNRAVGPVSTAQCNTNTTGRNGGLIQVKVVDGLTVTGNTQPGLSGPFVCALNSTDVNVSNNIIN